MASVTFDNWHNNDKLNVETCKAVVLPKNDLSDSHALVEKINSAISLLTTNSQADNGQARLDSNPDLDERFFSEMLADLDGPTLPFGLYDIHGNRTKFIRSNIKLSQALTDQLRTQAKQHRILLTSLCHLSWAQVLAQSSGCKSVVFGTVLSVQFDNSNGNDSAVKPLINILPLRVNMNDSSVESSVQNINCLLSELYAHRFASHAMAQRCSRLPADMPLFSALLNYRHNQQTAHFDESLYGITALSTEERSRYPLILTIDDDDVNDELRITVNVDSRISATRICAYMEQTLQSLADALQHTPQKPVRTLSVLPPEERHLLLHTFNQTDATYPTDRCLHQLFEEQVKYHKNEIAAQCSGEKVTYAELNAKANRLAHYLIQLGVKPDSRVGLCMSRNTTLAVAILGILKSGGACVSLDPVYPKQRLINILQDVAPICVLTDFVGTNALGTHQVQVVDMDQTLPTNLSDENPDITRLGLNPNHLAYIIYTSGSTGKPKGVMLEHRNITNRICWTKDAFDTKDIEQTLFSTSVSFDISIFEFFAPLAVGKAIYIVPDALSLVPSTISMINTVPSVMTALLNTKNLPQSLRALNLAGEPLSKRLIENIFAKVQISKLCNLYGPTETTVSTWHKYAPGDALIETIGKPVANTRIYLLNSQGEPVPLGVQGEIYIGGAGVARGYLNRPDLTAERFLHDPFCDTLGARMYRTGDIARYLPDGSLIYLGRTDQQVKVRGYRIEPGEIEACLVNHPRVREAVVQHSNDGSDARLIAYVVAEFDSSLARDLRTYLSSLLPFYMVPAAFVTLPALPLTPNGKLDRHALPVPDDTAFACQSYEEPRGELEEKLAVLWRNLLGIERISRHDNFFELGGHSLLLIHLLGQLRQEGLDTSTRAMFESSSLAALASSIFRHQAIITPPNLITTDSLKITPEMLPLIKLSQTEIDVIIAQVPGGIANIQDIYGLTPLQHGILYHHMMAEKGDTYLIVTRMQFTDRETLDLYADALQQVVERHDVFRTGFIWNDLNEPAQVVWRHVSSILTKIHLEDDRRSVLEQLSCLYSSHTYRFDLTQAPLLRLIAAPTTDGGWVALQLFHHIICDHFTEERFNSEVHAIIDGRSKQLLTPTPFRHVVSRARLEANPVEDKRYFSEMLADVDSPTLPFGLSDVIDADAVLSEAYLWLPQALTDQLRAQARRLQISLASLCHLAWAQLLAQSSGRESVVFGTILFGRFQAADGNDSAMGLLMNTLPLRLNIDDTTVETAVHYVHSQLIELLSHEYASLAMAQRCSRFPAEIPLFSALLNYRHNQHSDGIATPLTGMSVVDYEERTTYPLILSIDEYYDSNALRLTASVDLRISAKRICAYMEQTLTSLVDALQHTPQKQVRTLTVLPSEERILLLHTFNQTAVTYPTDRCLHQLFEEQVKYHEYEIAVQCEGEKLSYAELNTKANRVAHYLIQLGVKPESRVGLCMSRNTALVVGLLGILKSGGAFVPLDPVHPKQRLINILLDADPICVLTDFAGQKALGTHQKQMIGIDQALLTNISEDNPEIARIGLNPNHLAYVIYTSGSTGAPKGVMVEHRNVTNFIYSSKDGIDTDNIEHTLFASSVCFDMSIVDCFKPLSFGKSTYIVPDAISLEGIPSTESVIHTVPSAVTALLNASNIPSTLHTACLGGEPVSKTLIENCFAQSQISKLYIIYGPTETTVFATSHEYATGDAVIDTIGKPLANYRIYLLNSQGEPVPLGVQGEIYIGGAGVARGYLNRPDLTAERFLHDPFCDTLGARMYRTGDIARYLADGSLTYLGRTDQQVKVRGYRIEPGEIEVCLVNHPRVREAVVQPSNDGRDTRLIAYVVADFDTFLARDLRAYLSSSLPSYMVPAAFVTLSALPLMPNGKLDRRALPVPDDTAFACQSYEEPQGEMEEKLAALWRDLLGIERVSRHDNFFELGGHSLLVVRLLAQLRQYGLDTGIRAMFESSTLAALASKIFGHQAITTPPNLITTNSSKITPEMLPLIKLSQTEIDVIVAQVPGGIANIQDIYGLAPLQHGIMYHYMTCENGDPYLTTRRMHFTNRTSLERYANALQQVVERHDILRTAFIWEGLNEPAQIVWRKASPVFVEYTIDNGDEDVLEQLSRRFSTDHYKLDLSQAPLLRLIGAPTTNGGWIAIQLMHHIIGDNFTGERINSEVRIIIDECFKNLEIATPFRHVVAQTRLGANPDEDKRFFSEMLADVDGSTLPFGLSDIRGNKNDFDTAEHSLPQLLNNQLRAQARRLQISLASLCHLAWAQVLAQSSGRESVVFGTVLFGRFNSAEGNDSAIGLLMNTLPLRLNIDDTAVEAAVRKTHVRLSELLSHENASLVLAQRCSGLPANIPLFSALLNYRHNQHSEKITIPGITVLSGEDRTNYPLILSIDDNDELLRLRADVTSSVSATRICAYMEQTLISLVDALQHKPQQQVRTLTVVPPGERHLLLHTFNQTAVTYRTDRCLHQLFEEQVKYHENEIAVHCEGEELSYAELNTKANRLAHYLIQLGVKPDSRVALCVARGTALVVGVLGILKSGGTYVPLDLAYKSQRLISIIQDSDPLCVLTDSAGRKVLGSHETLAMDINHAMFNKLSTENPDTVKLLGLTPNHLAYIIYTSGSTGIPKGVMIEHKAIVNYVHVLQAMFKVNSSGRIIQFSSCSFDVSIKEIFLSLTTGARLFIPNDDVRTSDASLLDYISSNKITNAFLTPALFRGTKDLSKLKNMQALVFCGEAPTLSLLQNAAQHTVVYNGYGPTEVTIGATYWKYPTNFNGSSLPIGRPIPNFRTYVLNSHGEPVPLGAEGELYIGGAGVARGYLNRVELSAERFLFDPFSDAPGARMYRTGDCVRYLYDQNIVFLGRIDEQVKIRGYRIEPGEIEARLREHHRVQEAIVLPTTNGADKRLVAYIVAERDEFLVRDLRAYLSFLLPSYMVPTAYVCLHAFPIAPSGKLDRRALPVPDDTAFACQQYEEPKGELEEKLAAIWRDVLGIERISRHDNFFELGGHSLLVINLLAQLRKDGLDTCIRAMFESSSLAALASNIFRHQAITTPPNRITTNSSKITSEMLPLIKLSQTEIDVIIAQVPGGIANIQDIYGLTPLQHGILYHYMMAEKGDPYLIVTRMRFADRETLELYADALQQVVERHDVFRTAFIWKGLNDPAQVVWRHVSSILTKTNLEDDGRSVLEQLNCLFNSHTYRFDLTQAPLLRLIAAPTTDGGWVALQLFHHMICDHYTIERLNTEVHAIIDGRSKQLLTPTPFRHVVSRARLEANPVEDKRYFSEMLADVDSPTVPFGLSDVIGADTMLDEAYLLLPQVLTDQLRAQARRLQISLASLCHLAWAQVLAQSSGHESVVFGTILFGRFRAADGNDGAMGLLMNTLPLRLNIDDSPVEAAVHYVHSQLIELLSHEYASLAMAQRCSGLPAEVPLFSALFNYRHNQHSDEIATPLTGMSIVDYAERTTYPLTLSIDDYYDSSALRLTAIVDSRVSATRICAFMEQTLQSLSDALQHTPQKSVRTLTVLPPEERHLLLHTFNQIAATYSTDRCVHQLFEEQVKYHKNEIAVQCKREKVTYEELNTKANRLAHYLIQLGVKPDSRVGLCMSRNTTLAIAILGILKSGGACVSLDPNYPKQRLINILQDAVPICVLTDFAGQTALGTHQVQIVDMDQTLPTNLSDENPDITRLGLNPNHLAYIIYTSGSTGKPKGVMLEHRNITNHICWTKDAFDTKDIEQTLFSTSVNFDISIFEFFAPLAVGKAIYIVPDVLSLVPSTISMINTVPSVMTALLNTKNLPQSLRALNLAGEPLSKRLIENIFAKVQISKLCNLYGPTETTIYSTLHKYTPGDAVFETIGRPIANVQIYLLNSQGEPVPLGVQGEIYIGGAGVARGYLNRPDLTAERFLHDPFCDTLGARMYRTGDIARYLADGSLIYLGRTDQQVKVRGYRIEPGEIESCLVNHPRVREAVVQPSNYGSETRLIAYVVAEFDELLARDLRTYLSSSLPSYMVPAAFVTVSALPLMPNGKLDRRALPRPDDAAFACQSYEEPQGEMEEKLAVLWKNLLGVERVSRHDNFFELGGHSLLVMQLVNHTSLRDMHIDPHCVFSFPIFMDFARELVQNFCRFQQIDAAIPIRRTGNRMPIFAIAEGNGGIGYAFELSHEIDNRYPIYALPWPSFEDKQISSMEELATCMIPWIKQIQPNGPCALIGWSSGGLLGYEIVKQLIKLDYPVVFLGLLDSYLPCEGRRRSITDILLWSLAFKYPIFKTLNTSWWEHIRSLSLDEAVEHIRNMNTDIKDIDLDRQAVLTIQQYHYQEICTAYQIKPIPFKSTLFKADTWDIPLVGSEYLDKLITIFYESFGKHFCDLPSLGWEELVHKNNLHVIHTKGDHYSITIDPKHRAILAEKIEQSLNTCWSDMGNCK